MSEGGGGGIPPDKREQCAIQKDQDKMDTAQEKPSYLYAEMDSAPYRLYVEMIDNTKRINKFALGSVVRKMEKYRNNVTDMKYMGSNKIVLFCDCWQRANSMVVDPLLRERGYKVYIPRHLLCITGVVGGIAPEIGCDEILNEIESKFQVLEVYRLNRWVNDTVGKVPSTRVSITFRAKMLPEKIKLFGIPVKVQPYVRKLIFCDNCHRFGHGKANCRAKKRCETCSRVHDNATEVCLDEVKCLHCRTSDHRTTDPSCPARQREKSIKSMMARKNLTYVEAKEMLAPVPTNNFYDVLANFEDFPIVSESFAFKAGATTKSSQNYQKGRTSTTKPLGEIGAKRKRPDDHILQTDNSANNSRGAALNNPHSTTEKERWEATYNKMAAEAEEKANRTVQGDLMSFYSALFQIPEVNDLVKEKIKECSKKFFKFDRVIN